MNYTLGFIGCGNMGGALVSAAAKTIGGEKIAVYDYAKEKCERLKDTLGVATPERKMLARLSKFILLCVKPQNMQETVQTLMQEMGEREDVVLVTIAAGISIKAIQEFAGKALPVIRIMPNTPVLVGEGMIVYDSKGVSQEDEKLFVACFEKAGILDKLPEDKIDAASAVSGCGPAFAYLFAEALADGGVECGLPRDKAALYTAQTLLGAAKMLLEYGNPSALKDAVCSPGGTTIAGVHALEKDGLRAAGMDAVTAAYKRTLELKK